MLPEMSAFVKTSDGEFKWNNLLTKGDELLKRFSNIQGKVNNDIKKIILIVNPFTTKYF